MWRNIKYKKYINGMKKDVRYTFIVPRYLKDDNDGFSYSVKYPDYLSFVGNIALSIPSNDDSINVDSIIIWPTISGKYEYGVILYENENQYMVYIDEAGNALDKADDELIKAHKSNIDALLKKANENWILK